MTRSVFSLSDPSTWTISPAEVGPVALGGDVEAEVDDLTAAYARESGTCPATPETTFWTSGKAPGLTVVPRDGRVAGVAIGNFEPNATSLNTPTTVKGAGLGTPLTTLASAYPDLQYSGSYGEERGQFSFWSVREDGRYITFELGEDGTTVGLIWVSDVAKPPYEFCG